MKKNVLLVGYGSIGKRHIINLLDLGIKPYILTSHPDNLGVRFLNNINELKDKNISSCIISSPTARHLDDFRKCATSINKLKRVLIEKPLERSYLRGEKIREIIRRHKIEVSIAYNLRFVDAFDMINKFVKKQINRIKIVQVTAGQDLRQWRRYKDFRKSYSSHRGEGGGVDLDLSHEIDYILYLFGNKFKHKLIYRAKISSLQINSPDIFKLILDYKRFIVDVTLDYIRNPKERYLRIICENGKDLFYDFIKGLLKLNGKIILNNNDIDKSYKKMLRAFLGIDKISQSKLCSVEEALNVLRILEV